MPAPTEKPQAVALDPPAVVAPPMPEGWEHGGLAPAPLPSVIHPDSPATGFPQHFKPGSAYAGTGFFIAFDGSLLTAAHVVAGCTKAEIISSKVPLSVAAVLATDTRRDIALLRAPNVRPQAVLPIGSPPSAGRLFVLGYPATADLRVPEEDWPNLRTDRILHTANVAGGNDGIWLETTRITHGYSGGPVVDPRTGAVVAIVRAEITGGTIATIAAPGFHLTTGPTGDRLASFVHKEAPWIDLASTLSDGYEATEAARLATVHVICLH
jgi:S1-C subfamily serine protease